ncbi:MAG: outer membrane lipoprotein carrier protein LolA [Gemmatimonadota bacterium]
MRRLVGVGLAGTLMVAVAGAAPWSPPPGEVQPVVGAASRQEARALALLEEAGRRYREVQSFCADFEQQMVIPLLRETTRSKGVLCQERPNRLAMRFTDPAGDVVVADGQYFWVYFPSADAGQVLRFSMATRPGGFDFQEEFLSEPGAKYELQYLGEETVGGRRTHLLSAVPRQPLTFTRARIWLDAERSLILRAEIGQENGSVRTVTLSSLRLNPSPDPERFRFTPPPGAQVIPRAPLP